MVLAWCKVWPSALSYNSVWPVCDFSHWLWSRGRCSLFGCTKPVLIAVFWFLAVGEFSYTSPRRTVLVQPLMCLLQHRSPHELGGSLLSAYVRAIAEHSQVRCSLLGLWLSSSFWCTERAQCGHQGYSRHLLCSQPSPASAIGYCLWHTNFSLLLKCIFDGKCLRAPSLAIKMMRSNSC